VLRTLTARVQVLPAVLHGLRSGTSLVSKTGRAGFDPSATCHTKHASVAQRTERQVLHPSPGSGPKRNRYHCQWKDAGSNPARRSISRGTGARSSRGRAAGNARGLSRLARSGPENDRYLPTSGCGFESRRRRSPRICPLGSGAERRPHTPEATVQLGQGVPMVLLRWLELEYTPVSEIGAPCGRAGSSPALSTRFARVRQRFASGRFAPAGLEHLRFQSPALSTKEPRHGHMRRGRTGPRRFRSPPGGSSPRRPPWGRARRGSSARPPRRACGRAPRRRVPRRPAG
jgi:hypothetical protein